MALLREIRVVRVEPGGDGAPLLVVVAPSDPEARMDRDRALQAIERARGALRSAVAEAICRKKAPDLAFRLVPSEEVTG